jgi:hypothetical protein
MATVTVAVVDDGEPSRSGPGRRRRLFRTGRRRSILLEWLADAHRSAVIRRGEPAGGGQSNGPRRAGRAASRRAGRARINGQRR